VEYLRGKKKNEFKFRIWNPDRSSTIYQASHKKCDKR